MYIDENTLKFYLDNDNYKKLESNKKAINKRFDSVKEVFEIIIDEKNEFNKQTIIDEVKKLYNNSDNNVEKLINDDNDNRGLARIFINDTRFHGIKEQNGTLKTFLNLNKESNKKYISQENFITHLLSIMGGFDFTENPSVTPKVINEYRILSNKQKEYDFEGSTYSQGTCAWINSHFSDNTLFIEFVDFIKNCKEKYDGANIGRTNIALCYPGRVTNINTNDFDNPDKIKNDYNEQQKILNYRFPYKFMWMWANTDKVIHPISLDAFRNFLKSDFMQEIFNEKFFKDDIKKIDKKFGDNTSEYPKKITNCHFDSFTAIWKMVSEKVSEKLKCDNFERLSKVISFLCIGETDMKNISDLLETHKQIILYGVPGTGKTYSAKKVIYDWINDKLKTDNDDIKEFIKPYRFKKDEEPSKNIIWDIVQFHPNYSYQDFIGGIAPKVDNGGSLSYTLNDGIFKKFCDCAKKYTKKKFIFIIDEINRANLSEVFGELLYALEYRDESVSVANFDEFCIPSNVYIIGTMNNVDKSLATFDLALRRRFGFYEVDVNYDVIENIFKDKNDEINTNIQGYIKRCKELNYILTNDERLKQEINIEGLKGIKLENTQDYYKIGHAYFMKIKNFIDKDEFVINPQHLEKLWIYHIEPLLMEYLGLSYDDSDVKKSVEEIKKHFVKKLDNE